MADTRRRWKADIDHPKRTVSAARRLSCCTHPDLDSRTHCQSVSLDGSQRRARPHAAFQAAHGALRRPHSRGDFVLRHARGDARSYQIRHEELQRVIARERWRMPRGTRACQQRDAFGENLRALVHGPIWGVRFAGSSQKCELDSADVAIIRLDEPEPKFGRLRAFSHRVRGSHFCEPCANALPDHVETKSSDGGPCVRSNRESEHERPKVRRWP
jgi:hypothetical protein